MALQWVLGGMALWWVGMLFGIYWFSCHSLCCSKMFRGPQSRGPLAWGPAHPIVSNSWNIVLYWVGHCLVVGGDMALQCVLGHGLVVGGYAILD